MSNGGLIGPYNYPSKSVTVTVPTYIRYIRWYANGNNINSDTHFCELQALTAGGTNRALNAGINGRVSQYAGTSQSISNSTWQIATDGDTSSGTYVGFGSGGAGIQFDLGAIYTDISQIKFWNYYADSRTYYNVAISVSADNSTWTTLYAPTSTASNASGIPVAVPSSSSTVSLTAGMWKLEEQLIATKSSTWPTVFTISGGTLYSDSTYYYRVFTSSGSLSVSATTTADILVVAGGGGASTFYAGGGGAGGLLGFASQSLTPNTYTVTVGAGGAPNMGGSYGAGVGAQGGSSQFGSLTAAIGGGGGTGTGGPTAGSGGSGGGGAFGSGGGGSGTAGQGNSGGGGMNYSAYGGAGGGGATAGGTNGSYDGTRVYGGNGGNGSSAYSSWGLATGTGQNVSGTYWYAGGGGGSGQGGGSSVYGGAGGLGGGGVYWSNNVNGTANTGGGGAAWSGAGGSGIVIVRYLK